MSKSIDLGKKFGNAIPISISELKDETHYPTLHVDDIDDARLAEMPDSGQMVVDYKIRDRTHHEDKRNGKKKHTCSMTLDILSVEPPAPNPKKKDADGGLRKSFADYWKDKK